MPEIIGHNNQNSAEEPMAMDDLIGNAPGWLLYSGLTGIFVVTICVLSLSYFIKYPDEIQGYGILTSDQPAIELISPSTDRITELLCQNNQIIEKGETILYIYNTTNRYQIEKLADWIREYEEITNIVEYLNLVFPDNLDLGQIHHEYARLQLQYTDLIKTLKNGLVFQKIKSLDIEIKHLKNLSTSLKKENYIYKKEVELTRKEHHRYEVMATGSAVSKSDLEAKESELLMKERVDENMNGNRIQNAIRINQLKQEQLGLTEERSLLLKEKLMSMQETIQLINSKSKEWEEMYSIKAPVSGNLILSHKLSENISLIKGDVIGHIAPQSNQNIYVSCVMPKTSFGKIETGQKAIIRLEAFPYKEFGSLDAIVSQISNIPQMGEDNTEIYEIRLKLSQKLITDNGSVIPYKPNISGLVEVMTQEKTILERIFSNFIELI